MRMSIERSYGSHSRFFVSVRMRSRDSALPGCSAKILSRSNSIDVIGISLAVGVEELVRGEVEAAAAEAHALRVRRRWRLARSAAGRACVRRITLFIAREQLARVEGLRHVVVGADLEADDAVDDLARAGDHDDADVVALAQVAGEREPVLARQAQVEQHDVGRRALELGAHRRRRPRPARS